MNLNHVLVEEGIEVKYKLENTDFSKAGKSKQRRLKRNEIIRKQVGEEALQNVIEENIVQFFWKYKEDK